MVPRVRDQLIRRTTIPNTLPQLWPVVEAPYYSNSVWLWPVTRDTYFVRLGDSMSDEDIGSVFAQLVNTNRIGGQDVAALQDGIMAAERLFLPGGLQASLGERAITPGCYCGLECWRDWEDFLNGGLRPWLGHDPAPWVESAGNLVRVWSDGRPRDSAPDVFSIDFERPHLQAEVARAARELRAFLERSEAWARS